MTTTTTTDLGRIFPKGCSIMAKKELQYTPLLGQFMTLSNAVFVNRSRRADAVAVFAKVATTMKEKIVSLLVLLSLNSADETWIRFSCRCSSFRKARDQPRLLRHYSRSKKARSISPSRRNFLSSPSSAKTIRRRTRPRTRLSTAVISLFKVRLASSPYSLASGLACDTDDAESRLTRHDPTVLAPIPTIGITSSSEDITALAERTREVMLAALEELAANRAEVNRLKSIKA